MVRSWLRNSRRVVGSKVIESFFAGSSRIARLHPNANPARHGIEVLRDVAYGPEPYARLDIYRPTSSTLPTSAAERPSLLYVHGGGFRILSKNSHWVMALAFAKRGYTVYTIDYRLAPRHPYPAALIDTCAAFTWVVQNAARYGSSDRTMVVSGESAGGNLVTSLTLACCMHRPEPWAKEVFALERVPSLVIPFCGMFQVSNVARLWQKRPIRKFIQDRLVQIEQGYLGDLGAGTPQELADPLCVLEGDAPLARSLPPAFFSVGTWDPLLEDTERMERIWSARGGICAAHYYPREFHAFQAFVMRKQAQRCWSDLDTFRMDHDV